MLSSDDDAALRTEAMQWLAAMTQDGLGPIRYDALHSDFVFRGERQPLKDRQLGIFKPKDLQAALSITTTYRPADAARPYDDVPGVDGLHRYKWQGADPQKFTNQGLRVAMEQRLPLIWFWGVAQGIYKAIFPVYLVAEEPDQQQFVVATDGLQNIEATGESLNEVMRQYTLQESKRRLHQPVFRGLVMQAYETRCAVCELRHSVLLDAAHIVGDAEWNGIAATRNGLALCKIHHSAYDEGILGIDPDYRIAIREDILEEIDGPVLEYGLKRLHGEALRVVPKHRADRPDPASLEQHFSTFLARPRPAAPRVDLASGPTGLHVEQGPELG